MTHKESSKRVKTVAVWVAPLAAAVFAGPLAAQTPEPRALPSLAPMIERVAPAVVSIAVATNVDEKRQAPQDEFLRRFFDFEAPPGGRREVEGAGSGVIVDAAKGYVLTNHHVIANADKITVTLLENRSLVAKIIGSDEGSDLAVLQIEPVNLTSVPLGDSGKLRVGDYVVAIGNPFGFSNTVTSGIVSALGRTGINREAFEDFIQTDASINPGNSGGALVNLNGELVGINSAIISRTGGNVGIGFAIPVSMARTVMAQLVESGAVRRGLLGVNISDVTPDLAATLGLTGNSGALVTQVGEGSAAERAGIRIDDIIVSVNGNRVRDSGSLKNAVGLLPPGERVTVGIIRDGKEQMVPAVLGELNAAVTANTSEAPRKAATLDPAFDGAELVDNPATGGTRGLLITRVDQGSSAWQRGLRPGDIITKVNRSPVHSLPEAIALMQDARAIIVEIRRGERNQIIVMR